MSARFWPVGEAAQADYEQLRTAVLAGEAIGELLTGRRFGRRGLAGLIDWPQSQPEYLGCVIGACRAPWSGDEDPREAQLADAYGFLVGRAGAAQHLRAVGR